MAAGRHPGFCWILFSDDPRSLRNDLKLCLKFYVPGKILRFEFSEIWLKMPIRAKNGVFGDFAPKHFGLSSRLPKGSSLRETTHFDV